VENAFSGNVKLYNPKLLKDIPTLNIIWWFLKKLSIEIACAGWGCNSTWKSYLGCARLWVQSTALKKKRERKEMVYYPVIPF
jgi:hypothetical protein